MSTRTGFSSGFGGCLGVGCAIIFCVVAGIGGCIFLGGVALNDAANRSVTPTRSTSEPTAPKPAARLSAKTPAEPPRTWRDMSGKFEVQATFESVENSKIKLHKTGGGDVLVAWDRLCQADQDWIREHERARLEREQPQDVARDTADRLTMANYLRITDGMSLAAVQEILGPGRELASGGREFGAATQVVGWTGFLKSVNVTFQNNRVVMKAQFGL